MTKKDAIGITGGLSQTSKMPCQSYSLPPALCPVGSRLAKVAGSACAGCYADKGAYRWSSTQQAMYRRQESLTNPQWIQGMIRLISSQRSGLFRWHDAGDIQSLAHLRQIVAVCEGTPHIQHWLPTREYRILRQYREQVGLLPANLNVRVSVHMVDDYHLPKIPGVTYSTIHRHTTPPESAHVCPASCQGGKCHGESEGGTDCSACWDAKTVHVSYRYH